MRYTAASRAKPNSAALLDSAAVAELEALADRVSVEAGKRGLTPVTLEALLRADA